MMGFPGLPYVGFDKDTAKKYEFYGGRIACFITSYNYMQTVSNLTHRPHRYDGGGVSL
jgi:uncharacterized membrane protein YcgQ (UPF0703/DUF1980 family)